MVFLSTNSREEVNFGKSSTETEISDPFACGLIELPMTVITLIGDEMAYVAKLFLNKPLFTCKTAPLSTGTAFTANQSAFNFMAILPAAALPLALCFRITIEASNFFVASAMVVA